MAGTARTYQDRYKSLIRIQVTYGTNVVYGGTPYDAPPIIAGMAGGSREDVVFVNRETIVINSDWSVLVEDWRIIPNPSSESFTIWAGYEGGTLSLISEVVVDTICVPEPATICLLGLGGLLLRKRRA